MKLRIVISADPVLTGERYYGFGYRHLCAARIFAARFCSLQLRCSGYLTELFGQLLSQDIFLDFSCDCHREFFDKPDVARHLEGKTVVKVIYVPDKLLNIVVR